MQQVLVVDDDAAIRDAVRIVLVDEGYVVIEAATAHAALAILNQPDQRLVVLVDVFLPDSETILMETICANSDLMRRHTYVLCTAVTSVQLPIAALDLHIPFLHKPFDVDDLVEIVAEASQRLLAPVSIVPEPGAGEGYGVTS